jgi:hypothetical protein
MLLPWCHGFPLEKAYQEMEVDVADGVLKSGDVPLLERMFESVYPDIINTI